MLCFASVQHVDALILGGLRQRSVVNATRHSEYCSAEPAADRDKQAEELSVASSI